MIANIDLKNVEAKSTIFDTLKLNGSEHNSLTF